MRHSSWEPEESCSKAPECVRAFWKAADLKGRNRHNYKDFKKDDIVGLKPKGKLNTKPSAKTKAKIKDLESTPKKSASTASRSAKGRRASTTSASAKAKAKASPRKRRRASARV